MTNCNILNKKNIYKSIYFFLCFIFTTLTLLHNTFSNTKNNDINTFLLLQLQDGYETEHLYVRRTIESDIETLGKLFYDKDISTKVVPEIFHSDGFDSVEQSIEYINNNFKKKTYFPFTIFLKNDDIIIGEICFSFMDEDTINISYWLGTEYQGHGYMSELALDFIKYVFTNSKIKVLHIQCLSDNDASWRICCKIADNFEKDNSEDGQEYYIKQYCKKYEYRKNLEIDINILEIIKKDQ